MQEWRAICRCPASRAPHSLVSAGHLLTGAPPYLQAQRGAGSPPGNAEPQKQAVAWDKRTSVTERVFSFPLGRGRGGGRPRCRASTLRGRGAVQQGGQEEPFHPLLGAPRWDATSDQEEH